MFWGPSPATLTQFGRTPATVTTYTSYPLNCGATYYYGVEAVETSGNTSSMSPVISISTPNPPSPPNGLAATATWVAQVRLTLSAAASGGLPVTYYHVYRGTSPSALSQIVIDPQTSITDTSLSPSTTYYYAIEAADAGGDLSAMSAVASVTMPALPARPRTWWWQRRPVASSTDLVCWGKRRPAHQLLSCVSWNDACQSHPVGDQSTVLLLECNSDGRGYLLLRRRVSDLGSRPVAYVRPGRGHHTLGTGA